MEALAVPIARARILEDRHADALVALAIAQGAAALVATVPRLVIDLNRAETDLDSGRPGMPVSARARAGIGLVPSRLAGIGALWRSPPDDGEIARRTAMLHRPFHQALSAWLQGARARHGAALLLDLHSMPPLPGLRAAQIVIGSRHGASAAPAIVAQAAHWWRCHGYRVAVDAPYAGAHVLERHAMPRDGIHGLQIEIDRRMYLDGALDEPGTGLTAMQIAIADFARVSHEWVLPALPITAE